jgi:hypothetical protein
LKRKPRLRLRKSPERFAERLPTSRKSRRKISGPKINRRWKHRLGSLLLYTPPTPAEAAVVAAGADAEAAGASRQWLRHLHLLR